MSEGQVGGLHASEHVTIGRGSKGITGKGVTKVVMPTGFNGVVGGVVAGTLAGLALVGKVNVG